MCGPSGSTYDSTAAPGASACISVEMHHCSLEQTTMDGAYGADFRYNMVEVDSIHGFPK